MTKIYTPFLQELDITYPQYLVLLALWQEDNLSVKEIGERLYLESNTLTPLLKRLESKGLLQRMRSKDDERTVKIELSDTGKRLKLQAKDIPGKIVDCFHDSNIEENKVFEFQQLLNELLGVLHHKVKQNKE